MKKIYSSLGILSMILFSNSAFSQQRITAEQVQPIIQKLDDLGKLNPMGAFPLDKLSKEEYVLYKAYKIQQQDDKKYPYGITEQDLNVKVLRTEVQPILDKINQLGDSPLAFPDHLFSTAELKLLRIYELQNMKPQKVSNDRVFTKAYALDGRNAARQFGTLPLTPPITMTPTGSITNTIYADDIAGNGKMYALDNVARNLVTVSNAGVLTVVAPITNIPVASTLVGLSWNSVQGKMYVMAAADLYSIDIATGVATAIGATGLTTPIWLEIDNAGVAYTIDISTDNLYRVNLTTGATTLVGALGVNCQFAQEADFNRDTNQLYMASYTGGGVGGIYTINTTTGAATLVGDTTANNAEYTIFSIADSLEPPAALTKAFIKNSFSTFPLDFGTIPLTPPHTITSLGIQAANIFADDLGGDGNLYGLNNDSKQLVKVFSNGSFQNVGPLTNLVTGDTVTGLSWNRANNTMYAVSTNGTTGTLYSVNMTTGALTVLGQTTGAALPIWLEIDNAGIAYLADIGVDKLFRVNLTNGATTEVGNLGVDLSFAQDADFNTSNGVLYMSAFLASQESNTYTINTTTGAATLVGSTNGREITMFTIADTIPNAPLIPPLTCGDTYLDSGGTSGNYANSEDITTFFAPSTAGQAVKITFTQVEIEASATGVGTVGGCWDYLSIYNGDSITSPALAEVRCGETTVTPSVASNRLQVGDSFTSTDPSGKLTVRFRSDSSVPRAGWSATVSCAVLAVDNVNANKFSYYPNPTSGILNITAANKIENIEVYNTAGQKVLGFAPNATESEINMASLPSGLYLVKALVNGKVVTNKVIKK